MTDGLLVVDKPAGWTSHDVVARCRRLCGTRRVGHAGTLDPMATGVLVLGVDRGTRLLTHLVGCDKTYEATIRLGRSTSTDDAEGEITGSYDVANLRRSALDTAVAGLTGAISQVPSAVSAIKVDGRRAYARVRAGEQVALAARPVTVHRFEVRGVAVRDAGQPVWDVDVTVEVSSGTYVRALARDLGRVLGVGGHLTALRRTAVGHFGIERAVPLPALEALAGQDGPGIPLGVPPLTALADAARESFPARQLTAQEAVAVGFGQRVASAEVGRPGPVGAFAPDGTLVALLDETHPLARALVVFAPSPATDRARVDGPSAPRR